MKFVLSLILQAGLSYLLMSFFPQFPWWTVVVVSFVIGFLFQIKGWAAFLAGFIAMFGLWCGLAMYLDIQNSHLLTERIAQLFKIQPNYLAYITGIIGAILGGMSSLTGNLLRTLFIPQKKRYGTRRRKNRYNLNLE